MVQCTFVTRIVTDFGLHHGYLYLLQDRVRSLRRIHVFIPGGEQISFSLPLPPRLSI